MPELPEVETIRKGLEKYLVGLTIADIEVRLPKIITGEVAKAIGVTIVGVRRFGKGLIIDLNNHYSIAIHVKMTGQLIYQENGSSHTRVDFKKVGTLPGKHTHVIFKLKKQGEKKEDHLYYNDIRQFGWLKVLKSDDIPNLGFFRSLGPEPLTTLTIQHFTNILHSSRGPIKPLLMEQKKIAGVGNIYANDALSLARIHPRRLANSLSDREIRSLYESIENVLRKGLEVGGASEWQYVNVLGESGGYQNFFQVYGRDGESCSHCGRIIERIVMGGRSTFFCPNCQQE